ncbi:MAG: hypothetical protein PHU24_11735 [Sphaerochaetaceae bacterium]|nr:hypothetical protein [Sphaerochaetaceae bacterium]
MKDGEIIGIPKTTSSVICQIKKGYLHCGLCHAGEAPPALLPRLAATSSPAQPPPVGY